MKKLALLLAISTSCIAMSAQAGVIQTSGSGGGAVTISAFAPLGQSFVAQDAAIKFAFHYFAGNPTSADDPLQMSLLAGAGLGGAVLGTTTFSLADGFTGFYDVDLSFITLTVGQSYTAVLSVPGGSSKWAVDIAFADFANGTKYLSAALPGRVNVGDDFQFRATPVAAPQGTVPEPASLALAGLGLAALCFGRRKRA